MRTQGITDLDIIWAIRDIPRYILPIKLKSVLYTLVSLIGNSPKEWFYHSHYDLSEKIGSSLRRTPDLLNSLECLDFIFIKRPAHYTKGDSNEYKLNYELIIETANRFREQMLGSQSGR